MTKRQKKLLTRIIIAAVIYIAGIFLPLEGIPQLTLYLLCYAVIGWDIVWKAITNITHGQIFDENFLMTIATVGALVLGEYSEGVAVMLFYQIGEWFQSYAVSKSRKSITNLMDIRPDYANVERNGELQQVDPEEVKVGNIIIVRPGERIPLDGTILKGTSTLDTSALTGESMPRDVEAGMDVISGCINQTGILHIRTTKEFGESTVSKILDLVENASDKKAKTENFITRFAKYYTHIVIEDEIKPDAAEAITSLKSCGVRQTIMLTGDSDAVGQKVASKLGLDHAYTELLPADKVERVERLLSGKNDKTSLAFVGDGINDAPVLARADVGIAMGGLGSDAAIEAADVVLMTDEPSKIATVIKIARKTLRIAHENIVFALAVKFLVLFLGAIGYASMWAAVFADVGVSVIAILNAIRAMNVKKYN